MLRHVELGRKRFGIGYLFVSLDENLGYMGIMHVLTNPVLSLQPGILWGGTVSDCVREVSLEQVSSILMNVYVALPTLVGAWSMALGLWWHLEY